ncbi:MAG TPA: DUF2510 domain-containing protein [Pseudolysinimonas sp.]|nr:DUF2510 domain-containing protein [Pseudolysinimonas sp.]
MAQPLPVAGWYPDPEIAGQDRWWDGASWADDRRVAGDAVTDAGPVSAPAPVVRNNAAVIGFFLALSGLLLPLVVNSIAGGIVSIIGLRQSNDMTGTGIFSHGRGISIAGILIGFIWGAICLLGLAAFIAFGVWIFEISTSVQHPDSPVI